MKRIGVGLLVVAMMVGCEEEDERLAELAVEVVQGSRELVAADAQARQELVTAQKELNESLQEERASLDRQHEDLEQERRAIASARVREPIIAQALILLTFATPLLLAGYLIWQLNRSVDAGEALGELLVEELASDRPLLLPPASPVLLPHRAAKPGPVAPAEPCEEPPF